jgi:hypothetical protein
MAAAKGVRTEFLVKYFDLGEVKWWEGRENTMTRFRTVIVSTT